MPEHVSGSISERIMPLEATQVKKFWISFGSVCFGSVCLLRQRLRSLLVNKSQ